MRRALRVLASASWLALIGVGLPAILVAWVGWPLPDHPPTVQEWTAWLEQPLTRPFLTGAFAILLWALWALFVLAVLLDLLNRLTRLRLGRLLRFVSPFRALTTSLIGGLVTAPAAAAIAPVAAYVAQPAASDATTVAGPAGWTPARLVKSATLSGMTAAAAESPGAVHRVVEGDTLWEIARVELGDPLRWPEIYHLNQGKTQPNGYQLRDPDEIHVGWLLALPAETEPPPARADPPAPDPAPVTSPSAPTSSPTPGQDTTAPAVDQTDPDAGIDLGEHGWVTVEVAAAVAAAAALVWIHRRRRYRPRPPGPARRDDPDLTPLPRTVTALQRARRATDTEDDMDAAEPQTRDATLVTTASMGNHAGTSLRLSDLPALGIGLTGPSATNAARGLLAAALSAGGPWAPGTEATVVTTRDDLHQILPGHELVTIGLVRLHIVDTVDHALDELERHLLRRARLASDTTDLATALGTDDDQTSPPVVFLNTAPAAGLATRLAAVLTVGSRLGIVGVLLGSWPPGQTWIVNPDGTTTIDGHSGPRLNCLDATATLDILDVVRQAHPPEDEPSSAPTNQPASQRASEAPASQRQAPPPHRASPRPTRRLSLAVLGKPTIQAVNGNHRTDLRIRRTDGVQILVHLAVNPDGATSDELMALLWPDVRPQHSRRRFHTTMSELRQTLAEAIGADPIVRTDDRYRLEPDIVDVDLWTLNAAIDQAATAVEPAEHDAALHHAISLYTGAIAEPHNWLWLAPYREATRRHLVDAYVALAETEAQPRQALALVQDAIRLEPYNEDLYQRAMLLHARLASPDGVRRTLRTLTERLNELEVGVTPQTQQIATEILQRLGTRERIQQRTV